MTRYTLRWREYPYHGSGDTWTDEGEFSSIDSAVQCAYDDCAPDANAWTVHGALSWDALTREMASTGWQRFKLEHCTGETYEYELRAEA